MTIAEFKAWFEGFTEQMSGPPTAEQWDRVKERVEKLAGSSARDDIDYRLKGAYIPPAISPQTPPPSITPPAPWRVWPDAFLTQTVSAMDIVQ